MTFELIELAAVLSHKGQKLRIKFVHAGYQRNHCFHTISITDVCLLLYSLQFSIGLCPHGNQAIKLKLYTSVTNVVKLAATECLYNYSMAHMQ